MAVILKLTCMALICMSVAVVAADAALTCSAVTGRLGPCLGYLSRGGRVPPACCAGVRGLNGLARTTADRRTACRCLQTAARNMGTVNAGRAAGLPGVCGVRIPYPINLSTNCNTVK